MSLQRDASKTRHFPIALLQTQSLKHTRKAEYLNIAKAIPCPDAYYGEWCHTWRMILARMCQKRSAEAEQQEQNGRKT
jgi:hypothetical protein